MMTCFNHENVNAFIGYCDEGNEMIIVYEYAVNGSLDYHLLDPDKMRCMTWEQRLKICIGAARGLNYLHSGLGENKMIIHRNVKSANIVLGDNMKAVICGFDLSLLGSRYQPHSHVFTSAAGTKFYLDPVYVESGILKTETDVYSFGVVMFEMLSGMIAYHERSIEGDAPGPLIRRYFEEGLERLIDPHIRDQINSHSFMIFKELACDCLSFNLNERPTMDFIIQRIEVALELQKTGVVSTIGKVNQYNQYPIPISSLEETLVKFHIPVIEIKRATNNFSSRIGHGGFGMVYIGQLSERWENLTVAIKRLSQKSHQGESEFRNELKMISGFNHENIIPFIGYCDDNNEKIIVYKYAVNRSLDHHLEDPKKRCCLTWAQRLVISLGAARGIQYLHSDIGQKNRIIHRDIKSGNILLDDNMEAMISDFGLSKYGPKNQAHTQVYTKAAGTHFYLDPIYHECGILTKESDVYSYGVVLFELLSGMLAYTKRDIGDGCPQHLMNLVRRYELENLIDPFIKDQIDARSFQAFKEVAYGCVSFNIKERPTMDKIIERIQKAYEYSSER